MIRPWARRTALLFAWLALATPSPARAAGLAVALYDPDGNLSDPSKLRASFGAYLRELEPSATFHPFLRLGDLRAFLPEHPVSFAILPPDAIGELGLAGARALLQPLRGDRPSYRKLLVIRERAEPASIRIVATTAAPAQVRRISSGAFAAVAARVRILRVSKEIDALLGMTFGRADAAYVTPETLAQLGRFDPELAASLKPIYESPPIPNPLLYLVGKNVAPATERKLVEGLLRMNQSPTGQAALRLLGYSRWRVP